MDTSQLTSEEFDRFRDLIFQVSGMRVPDNKVMLLSNRIRRRVKATGVESFEAYFKLLRSLAGKDEVEGLLNAVTTNETSFFRTEKHFDWLGTEFVEQLQKKVRAGAHPRQVRVWSAACSTGEEPYTIAMCLAENRPKFLDWKLEVHGTDISEDALAKARAGSFKAESLNDVPEKLRAKYFVSKDGGQIWDAKPAIKDMVSVRRHNLMERNPQRDYDCIFIRNVLIYFNRESKGVVIDHLVRSLADGGYLVVGPSEGIFDMLGMLEKRSTFLYQKPETGARR